MTSFLGLLITSVIPEYGKHFSHDVAVHPVPSLWNTQPDL